MLGSSHGFSVKVKFLFWFFRKEEFVRETLSEFFPEHCDHLKPLGIITHENYRVFLDFISDLVCFYMQKSKELKKKLLSQLERVLQSTVTHLIRFLNRDPSAEPLDRVLKALLAAFLDLFTFSCIKDLDQQQINSFEKKMISFLKSTSKTRAVSKKTSESILSKLLQTLTNAFSLLLDLPRPKRVFETLNRCGLIELLFSEISPEVDFQLQDSAVPKEAANELPDFTLQSFPSSSTLAPKVATRPEPARLRELELEKSLVNVYLNSSMKSKGDNITRKILMNRKNFAKKKSIQDNVFDSISNPNFTSINSNVCSDYKHQVDNRESLGRILNRKLGSPSFEQKKIRILKDGSFRRKKEINRHSFFKKKMTLNSSNSKQSTLWESGKKEIDKIFELRKQSLQRMLKTPKDHSGSSLSLFHSFKQEPRAIKHNNMRFKGFIERKYSQNMPSPLKQKKRVKFLKKEMSRVGRSLDP